MPEPTHLVIPGAGLPAELAPRPALPSNLAALLARMEAAQEIACEEDSPSMPYELVLARLNGLPDAPGLVPWAAFETGTFGRPCAWIRPCHWRVGTDHIVLDDPEQLALDAAASRALLAAALPYFNEDGIALEFREALPGAWFAHGEVFRGLPTVSQDRAIGRVLTPAVFELPARHSPVLRRLQNEMQMLFYTHPVNDERQQRGLTPVNSFWIAGAGVLEQPPTPAVPTASIAVETRLHASAVHGDWATHEQAWREVDADACAHLLAQLEQGEDVRLTLCGERIARTYAPARTTFFSKISSLLGRKSAPDGRTTL